MIKIYLSLLLVFAFTCNIKADWTETKYIVDRTQMSDQDASDLLNQIAQDPSGRIFSTPTTNYLFIETQTELPDMEISGKATVYEKTSCITDSNGMTTVQQSGSAIKPKDWNADYSVKEDSGSLSNPLNPNEEIKP